MSYEDAKRALDEENGLLSILYTVTTSYAKTLKPGSLGEFIVLDWAGSFSKLQKLNAESLGEDDVAFQKTFDDEKALLQRFLKVTDKAGFGTSWAQLFKKDIEIADRLLASKETAAKMMKATKAAAPARKSAKPGKR